MKYTNNEAYFDVIEEVDAIIDKTGAIVSAEIQGRVSSITLSSVPNGPQHHSLPSEVHELWEQMTNLHEASFEVRGF